MRGKRNKDKKFNLNNYVLPNNESLSDIQECFGLNEDIPNEIVESFMEEEEIDNYD